MTPGALDGLRVLDLSRVLSGPFCTAFLADLGAQVIKVEAPESGDDARRVAPFANGESGYFMLLNRGKRSITLNLKSPDGLALLHRLAKHSDVLVENFRPGVTARLGIDYQALRARNPRLVYASISGFGQEGPLAHRASYDIVAQAMSGLMSITGWPDGPPTRVGESIADICTGLYAALGILAALRARDQTGEGQHLGVSLLDATFSLLVTATAQYFFGGRVPNRVGNRHPLTTPFDTYRASDGWVVIAVITDRLFGTLVATIGLPELASDPRFADGESRTENQAALKALIESWTSTRTVDEIVTMLESAGVPVSPIWTLDQVIQSDHMRRRGLVSETPHPIGGSISVVQQPVIFSRTPSRVAGPPPRLGEHTEDVLAELLGLSSDEIARLRTDGAI